MSVITCIYINRLFIFVSQVFIKRVAYHFEGPTRRVLSDPLQIQTIAICLAASEQDTEQLGLEV